MSKGDIDDDLKSEDEGLELDPGGVSPRRGRSDEAEQRNAKCGRVADRVVTQAQAKAWFDSPAASTLGHGANGYLKALILDERSSSEIGRVVAIKRLFVENDEKQLQFQDFAEISGNTFRPRAEVLRDAQHEVCQHLYVWNELMNDADCRKWIAQPAKMGWEQLLDDNGVYTVQELLYDKECAENDPAKLYDCRAMTFMSVKDANMAAKDKQQLWRLIGTTDEHDEQKKEFCRNYGRILACLARAKILHMDVHDENLMVFTNYTEDTAEDLDEGQATLRWAGIIDWGLAQRVKGEGPLKGDLLCQKKPYEVGYRPRLQPATCYAEENDSMDIANSFSELLWGNASCKGKNEQLCGTEGLVRQCIHEGFAGTLGLRIPTEIRKDVRRQHLEEYKQRGGAPPPPEPTPSPSAAAVRAAIRDMGMPNLSKLVI